MDVAPSPEIAPILEAASDFASYPGLPNDISVRDFLDRFPLPVLFGVLQTKADAPSTLDIIVTCLDKIFRTKCGASLLLNYDTFIQAGLQANSPSIRCLACNAVAYLLENASDKGTVLRLISGYNIYPLLISCLIDGDEKVSTASISAIMTIAQSSEGLSIIFHAHGDESLQLKHIATHSSSLARIRVLSLVVRLFSLSSTVATAVYDSNLLQLFEQEINNGQDMLTTLSALELLYELVQSSYSTKFLLKTTLLQLLTNIIGNSSVDPILRSRAALISGRLLSSVDAYEVIDTTGITTLLGAIDGRLKLLDSQDMDECESALEALGLIGSTAQGASLLLTSSTTARHVVESAFNRHRRGTQLAGLHALSSICGVERSEDSVLLDGEAEESLKLLIYSTASNSPKMNPSGLLLSVLQQEPEIRLAGYRLISALVMRPWCLMEVCSKQEMIAIVTDAKTETIKNGMEARHNCCVSISKALSVSSLLNDATVSGVARKLQEAVRRGPFLAKEHMEAQPIVITADRF